ncbi:hypothetical protein [Gallintestinimicrobium sp.]|uniref:hypothetical protein n=1 Tax=Gallintestinimicrobium sp. TaxID=2981655 RepID=UPI0039936CE2
MKKRNYRNLAKFLGFAVVIGIMLGKITSVLNYKDTGGGGGWQRFYEMPQKTAEVMFLEAAMRIVQLIIVCYGIDMEFPVIHCLLVHND